MKEQLHTIPVNEAFETEDECPFCALERDMERRAIRYVVGPGASYMEPDVRAATDKSGFCIMHMKKLFDYGNTLGAALILQTHFAGLLEEFTLEAETFELPPKKNLLGKRPASVKDAYWQKLQARVDDCYICNKVEYNMKRYYHTFFVLLKEDEFRKKVENTKGFCIRHFARMMQEAETYLANGQMEWFYNTVWSLMEKNLYRVKEDLDWLVAKYDYRNSNADWKNSRDALPRTMQKLQGLYPADPPYKNE